MQTGARSTPIRAVTEPERYTRWGMTLTAALIGVYVILRLYGLTRHSLWGGETFLLDGIRLDWAPMMAYLAEDMVHPPLSYVLLRLWVAVGGESLLWLKLFPALAAIAALAPLLLLCRELRLGRFEINLVLALAAVNGFLIHYAQSVRMYSLFLFFATCSAWLFVRYYNTGAEARSELVALSAVNLLLIYTHYFGWFVVGMEVLILLIWHRRRLARFAVSVGALVAAFLPWVLLVAREYADRGSTIGFIPPPSLKDMAYLYANLNGPVELWGSIRPGLVIFAVPVAWWFLKVVRKRTEPGERMLFWWLAGFSFVPVALVAALSRTLRDSFFFDRYFIFMAPLYLILLAASVSRLRPTALRAVYAGVLVLASTAVGLSDLSTNRMAWTSPQVGSRVEWEEAARQLAAALPPMQPPVDVYALPVMSNNRLTGSWAIITSIPFHMDEAERRQFRFIGLARQVELLWEPLGREFWVATFDLGDGPLIPEEQLRDHGYAAAETIRVGRPGSTLLMRRFVESDSSVAGGEDSD